MLDLYYTDTITVTTATKNQWQEVTGTTIATHKCRFEFMSRLIKNMQGEDVVSSAQVFMGTDPGHDATITYNGVAYVIIKIQEMKHFSTTHYMVFLQ